MDYSYLNEIEKGFCVECGRYFEGDEVVKGCAPYHDYEDEPEGYMCAGSHIWLREDHPDPTKRESESSGLPE